MHFLVTGGAGFIGSHLTEELLKNITSLLKYK
ncbi:NAD-dependent epimerase/dehydratase family protein [Cylindrospermum stagnale]